MISKRQWRKVLDTERRLKVCRERGFHVRSGHVEQMMLGGKPYDMERCADCGVSSEVNDRRWSK